MYFAAYIINTKVDVVLPKSRGSRIFGVRVVAQPTGGQTLADAYSGLQITSQQTTNNPNAGNVTAPNTTDTINVVDDSTMGLCSPNTLALLSPNAGQSAYVYLLEGQAEQIYPGSYGLVTSGGGGNNPSQVTVTSQTTATGYTPTSNSDGCSLSGAKGVRVSFNAGLGVIQAGGGAAALAWRNRNGVWMRTPDLDVPINAAGAGGALYGVADIASLVGQANDRFALIPNAAAVSVGTVQVVYEVQS